MTEKQFLAVPCALNALHVVQEVCLSQECCQQPLLCRQCDTTSHTHHLSALLTDYFKKAASARADSITEISQTLHNLDTEEKNTLRWVGVDRRRVLQSFDILEKNLRRYFSEQRASIERNISSIVLSSFHVNVQRNLTFDQLQTKVKACMQYYRMRPKRLQNSYRSGGSELRDALYFQRVYDEFCEIHTNVKRVIGDPDEQNEHTTKMEEDGSEDSASHAKDSRSRETQEEEQEQLVQLPHRPPPTPANFNRSSYYS